MYAAMDDDVRAYDAMTQRGVGTDMGVLADADAGMNHRIDTDMAALADFRVLADEGLVAVADAPVVKRLRAAGAVIVAKTNMSEFAFSGVGANPHFGTPGNPFDRARVPGGSTSGGAYSASSRP